MRVLQAIFISIALHFFLGFAIKNWPTPIKKQKVEISLLTNSSHNETKKRDLQRPQQLVTQTLAPEKLQVKESDDRLHFLSEKAQRVKEQTRAAISGLTANRENNRENKLNSVEKKEARRQASKTAIDPFSSVHIPQYQIQNANRIAKTEQGHSSGPHGFSTIAESVDVKIGSMTALNTDQYLFYSFFNRINDLVYIRWASLVQSAQGQVASRLIGKSFNTKWSTEVDIWIKPNGEFHSAHIMRESSVREFDQAAVQAFKQAGLFPHPPPELVEEDGFIHLKYNLTVFFDPRSLMASP